MSKFIKHAGDSAKDILEIIQETLRHELIQQLQDKKHYNTEFNQDFKNESAYIVVNGNMVPNETYAVSTKVLTDVLVAGRMMIQDFVENLPEDSLVNFRKELEVGLDSDSVEPRYRILFRVATVKRGMMG